MRYLPFLFIFISFLAHGGLELQCGSSKSKAFPYTVVVKKKNKKRIMTLVRGKKVLLRTPAKKLAFNKGKYEAQYSSGPSFNLSVDADKKGAYMSGYLRARYVNDDGANLVAGTLVCRKI